MDKLIPGFILKLWKMINDPNCDVLVWSDNGQSFIITDPPKFSQELSKYFKHNNLSSFIRQLNMYGFRKVATIENITGTEDLHFYHTDFIKGRPEKLENIKRKLPQKLADSVDIKNVEKGLIEIKNNHNDVSKTLSEIKRENEMLWAELHDLRQKHQQQQLYITRLMKLVFEAMEQNGIKTNMLPIKRHSPLMIEGADEGSHKTKRTRSTVEDDNVIYETTTPVITPVAPTIVYDSQIIEPCEMQQAYIIQPDVQPEAQTELAQELQQTESIQEIQPELQIKIQPDLQTELQQEIQTDLSAELQQQPIATTSSYELPRSTTTLDTGDYQGLVQSIDYNADRLENLEMDNFDFSDQTLESYNDIFTSGDNNI